MYSWPQALYELVSNGFKFSHGPVRFAAAVTAPGTITLSVTDTGPGIPTEELPRIWGPFHQVLSSEDRGVARRSDGLGLGLYLVGANPSANGPPSARAGHAILMLKMLNVFGNVVARSRACSTWPLFCIEISLSRIVIRALRCTSRIRTEPLAGVFTAPCATSVLVCRVVERGAPTPWHEAAALTYRGGVCRSSAARSQRRAAVPQHPGRGHNHVL